MKSTVVKENLKVPKLRFGEFSGAWEETMIGNICTIKRGASPRPITEPKWFDNTSKIGWVRISDVTKSNTVLTKTEQFLSVEGIAKSRLVKKGNLIMSICATIGKPIYTGFDVCIHDGFVVFDDLKCNHQYLFYYLYHIQNNWYRYGQPGTQVNLNSTIVSEEYFPLPSSIAEQEKIANYLSALDEKLNLLSEKEKNLAQYKKAMMQKLFAQEIRFKDDEGKEFEAWEEKTLKEVSSFRRGSFPQPYGLEKWYDDENGFPFVQVYDVDDNFKLKPDTKRKISALAAEQSVFVPKNTLLVTIQGSIGRIAITTIDCYVDRTLLIITSIAPTLSLEFYKYSLFLLFEIEKRKAPGGTIKTITKEALSDFMISVPCLAEQEKIAQFLSAIDEKINAVQKQIAAMQEFKKAMLQQMFV